MPLASETQTHRGVRGQATILLARRAPTIKQWSLDARSEGPFARPLWGKLRNQTALAWANGTSRRASGWAGEKVAHREDQSTPIT